MDRRYGDADFLRKRYVECGLSNSEYKARFGRDLDAHHRAPVR